MKAMILLIGVLSLPLATLADDTLQERMSDDEFQRAGLHRLSEAELEYLNDWLAGKHAMPAPSGPTDRQMGLREAPEPVVIETRIAGEFNGWSGRTRFTLENGQVWEQVGGGTYYHRADSPAVRIEPKTMGSWKMYIEGIGRSVKVKRIK